MGSRAMWGLPDRGGRTQGSRGATGQAWLCPVGAGSWRGVNIAWGVLATFLGGQHGSLPAVLSRVQQPGPRAATALFPNKQKNK